MKIAVTGAGGFIGSNMVRILGESGHQVSALYRTEPTGEKPHNANVEIKIADVRDKASLKQAFDGCDVVIHLAALFNRPEATQQEYRDTNVTGLKNVLEAADELGIARVVHCSTVGVASGGKPPYSEGSPYAPPEWDKYETTKSEAEQLAIEYNNNNEMSVFVIRPAQVYGPGDLGKIKFYKMVKKGVIVSQGKTRKHLIYIDDLCRAFERACQATQGEGIPIIVAAPKSILLRDLVKIVAKELNTSVPRVTIPALPVTIVATVVETVFNAIGKKPPIFRRSMNFFTKSVEFEIRNAKQYLDFESTTTTEEGVRNTARWYQDNGHLG